MRVRDFGPVAETLLASEARLFGPTTSAPNRLMFSRDPGLDLSSMDLDAVTIAEQPRRPYRTPLWRNGDEPVCDWTQSTDSVTIFLQLRFPGPGMRPTVQFMAQRMRVAARGGPGGGSVLLEADLGGRVDPDECEWRVEGGELVIVLRKEKHREWAIPLKPSVPAAPEATGGSGGGSSSPAVPSASRAAPPGPPPPKPLSASDAAAAAASMPKKSGLSAKYADWDRFDQEAALVELENEGKPDEPNMELRSSGKGGAVGIQCTDYKKDKEEVALDEEIAVKREQLQATLNGRLESAADLKRRGNALLAKVPSDARGALALYLDGVDALEVRRRVDTRSGGVAAGGGGGGGAVAVVVVHASLTSSSPASRRCRAHAPPPPPPHTHTPHHTTLVLWPGAT